MLLLVWEQPNAYQRADACAQAWKKSCELRASSRRSRAPRLSFLGDGGFLGRSPRCNPAALGDRCDVVVALSWEMASFVVVSRVCDHICFPMDLMLCFDA